MALPSVTNSFVGTTLIQSSQVNQNFTDLINAMTDGTKNFSISALAVGGTLTLSGLITSSLLATDNTYDIGASGATRFRNLYLAGIGVISGVTGLTSPVFTASSGGTAANFSMYQAASKLVIRNGTSGMQFVATDNTVGASIDETNVYFKHDRSVVLGVATVSSTATIAALASTKSSVYLSGSTATDLQGIAAGMDGQLLTLISMNANVTIRHLSGSASAGNKIHTASSGDLTINASGYAMFQYNGTDSLWCCLWVTS